MANISNIAGEFQQFVPGLKQNIIDYVEYSYATLVEEFGTKLYGAMIEWDGNPDYPTHCEHDELWIVGIDPEDVSKADIKKLDELGFFIDDDGFKSFKFGSA